MILLSLFVGFLFNDKFNFAVEEIRFASAFNETRRMRKILERNLCCWISSVFRRFDDMHCCNGAHHLAARIEFLILEETLEILIPPSQHQHQSFQWQNVRSYVLNTHCAPEMQPEQCHTLWALSVAPPAIFLRTKGAIYMTPNRSRTRGWQGFWMAYLR